MAKPHPAPSRLSLATILTFSAGALPLAGLGTAMSVSVQPYFAQDLGVGLTTIALAFFWVRILDLGVDPVLAVVMDRTRTPLGRYRAWTLIGTPILVLAVYQLFMAKKGVGLDYLVVWVLVYALSNTSIVTIARQAWSANLVTRYDQRARFYGYLGFTQVVGILAVLGAPPLAEALHWRINDVHLMGWIILGMLPATAAITALAPEPISAEEPSKGPRFALSDYWAIARKPEVVRIFASQFSLTLGPGWMANMYFFFFVNWLGFSKGQSYTLLIVYILAGIFGAPLIGYFGGRFGKHRTLLAAALSYSAGLCTILVLPKDSFILTLPIMTWCGFMANGFDLMTSAMMADVGDQVRLEQGRERMALLFSVTSVAQKLAGAAAVIIAYPLLQAVGYVPTLGPHNTQAALNGLEAVFIIGPIFWVVVGGLCVLGWKLDAAKHAQIRTELEARDARLDTPNVSAEKVELYIEEIERRAAI